MLLRCNSKSRHCEPQRGEAIFDRDCLFAAGSEGAGPAEGVFSRHRAVFPTEENRTW